MSRAPRPWLCAGLLAALCIASPSVRAQSPADDAIARGVELRKQGKNAEALAEFERAYAQSPTPRAVAQIALARQALGQWVQAEQGLLRALAEEGDPWIAHHLASLRGALVTVRDHLASLRVETDVKGATIWIGGEPIGTAPLPSAVRVAAGEVHIEARAEGRLPATVTLTLAPRAEEQVRLALPAAAPPIAAEPAAPERAAPATATAEPERTAPLAPAAPRQSPPDTGSGERTGAVIAFVVGGVLLGGAITAHAIRERDVDNYNDDGPDGYCRPDLDCSALRERALTAETLAIIGYAAAGAVIATGVVLWLVAPDPLDDTRATLKLGIDPRGGARVVLGGTL